jgi:hypothetical protein
MNIGPVHSSVNQRTYMAVFLVVNWWIYRGHQWIKKNHTGHLFPSLFSLCVVSKKIATDSTPYTASAHRCLSPALRHWSAGPPWLGAAFTLTRHRRPLLPPHKGIRTTMDNHHWCRLHHLANCPLGVCSAANAPELAHRHRHHPRGRHLATDTSRWPRASALPPHQPLPLPHDGLYPEPTVFIAAKVFSILLWI